MAINKKIWTFFLVGIAALLVLPGMATAKEDVVEIPVGLNLELTGGLASSTMPASFAILDYFNYINEQGGFTFTDPTDKKVYRAKWKIMWADNGFSIARSMSNAKRFIDRGAKLMLGS